jgi:hypothetical protein
MAITTKTEKQSDHPCGYCSTGNRHDLCPGGVLNGNGTEVYLCGCKQHDPVVRCVDCNNRTPGEVSRETWTCLDVEACEGVRASRRAATDAALGTGTREARRKVEERATRAPAKPKTGKCVHCGETTGGGKFLPGHDAKYLAEAVTEIRESGNPSEALSLRLDAWQELGLSEALRAKLAKRVS